METRFIEALHCRNKSRPPVWLMRQAGRYLPEYRKIREKYSFLEMCHQPELAAQITRLPIEKFGMDAAILFSDILVVLEALDRGVRFEEGIGPVIERPVHTAADIHALPHIDVKERLGFVAEAIKATLTDLKVPLIGFCGGPFTVASYLIEGGSSRDFKKTKQWMMRDPTSFHALLALLTEVTIHYLQMQAQAGVHAIQVFDSWANALGYAQFEEFSLKYLKNIVDALKSSSVPVILFCRGSSVFASDLADLHPEGISLDWNVDLLRVRNAVPSEIALQGNLDPDILYASNDVIEKEVGRLLEGMRNDPGYIFNLGHGVKPDIPVESVRTLVETVKKFQV